MFTTFRHQPRVSLQIDRSAAGQDSQAWKKMIGTKPVNARLELLPETKLRRSALLTSTLFQVAVAAFVVALPLIFPYELRTSVLYEVIPVAPLRTEFLLPTPSEPRPVRRAEIQPAPEPVAQPEPPRLTRRTVFAPMVAAISKPREIRREEVPQVNEAFSDVKFETNQPTRPREPVKTGVMATGSAAPATIERPVEIAKVQTGGFGDVRGLPGESNLNRRATIARQGSPALPAGPGYGNGTGGATGVRGTVASAGFGNGVAIAPAAANAPRGEVRSGGFATAAVTPEAARPKQNVEAAPAVQPVVILEKPNPVYTQEARRLGIEGEVQVQVVFPASGPVRVLRVTKGLGHGLDEAAIRAAQQIRFKPALQQGRPVDFPATVHIVFQLAF
jgi:TonB family protein